MKFFEIYIEKIHIYYEGDLHWILLVIHRHNIFFFIIETINFFINPVELKDIEKIIVCDMKTNNKEVSGELKYQFNDKKHIDDD